MPDNPVDDLFERCLLAIENGAPIEPIFAEHPAYEGEVRRRLENLRVSGILVPPDDVPEQLGPYRVLRVLGQGGMGVVFLGEQDQPVRRQVAIKVIKLGMDSRQVLMRFEAERQALALMNHPGIAKMLEAGTTEQGRPYFVMEYVDGEPINNACDRLELTLSERLRLFQKVCNGVEHAHQKLSLIHISEPTRPY